MRPNYDAIQAVRKLTYIGYRFMVNGENIKARYDGPGDPDPAQVRPLLEVVKEHKEEVKGYLKSLVVCADCAHAQVGQGWAICQGEPWDGISGQASDFQHPCSTFAPRTKPIPPPERILSCSECPWRRANPWTHYPELPAWCQHHMDHLLQDNPACIGYKHGEVPKPAPYDSLGAPGAAICPRSRVR